MGNYLILNGSPRAPRSNSLQYIQLLRSHLTGSCTEYALLSTDKQTICQAMETCDDVILVFPLYADCLPTVLLEFLHYLQEHLPQRRPTVHIFINCGFLEPEQNDIALDILRLFCKQTAFPFGSSLAVGGGEAFLKTPFAFLLKAKIKKFAKAIDAHQTVHWKVTMPISKPMFIKAANSYWLQYGAKNGLTQEQMSTMEIEGK